MKKFFANFAELEPEQKVALAIPITFGLTAIVAIGLWFIMGMPTI